MNALDNELRDAERRVAVYLHAFHFASLLVNSRSIGLLRVAKDEHSRFLLEELPHQVHAQRP